jgi:hypothetical protein
MSDDDKCPRCEGGKLVSVVVVLEPGGGKVACLECDWCHSRFDDPEAHMWKRMRKEEIEPSQRRL